MSDKLYRVAYVSRSLLEGDDGTISDAIQNILESARKNNALADITGALLFSGDYFGQVLEGEETALDELLKKLEQDPRHSEVSVLCFEPVEQRIFNGWAMAWTGPLKGKQSEVQGMLRSKDEIGVREQGLSLINMLDYLVNQQQGRENSVRQPAQAS